MPLPRSGCERDRGNVGVGNRVAILTGGAGGIGQAIATKLVADGCYVVIADQNEEGAHAVAAQLGQRATGCYVDIADAESCLALTQQAIETVGTVAILVNAHGITGPFDASWRISLEDWERGLRVNLSGVFHICRHVVPHMRERGYGRIVNISSIAGLEGNPNNVTYSAAKAGVIGFTRALAKEVARDGIMVNAVTPGTIDAPMLRELSAEHEQALLATVPMGRVGKPDEVAELVAWLCSDACSYSTGAVYDVSGGRAR